MMRAYQSFEEKVRDLPRDDYGAGDERLYRGDPLAGHRGQGGGAGLSATVSRHDVVALSINDLSGLLRGKKVAIIGLAGRS